MKIILSPMGTTGDIRPAISLAIALQKAGHNLLLVVPGNANR